jgi:hypothetical protein
MRVGQVLAVDTTLETVVFLPSVRGVNVVGIFEGAAILFGEGVLNASDADVRPSLGRVRFPNELVADADDPGVRWTVWHHSTSFLIQHTRCTIPSFTQGQRTPPNETCGATDCGQVERA